MTEQWLPVVGWEGLYEVSDFGSVRSIDRFVRGPAGSKMRKRGRVLKVHVARGYLQVTLSRDTQLRYASVHSLVLEAFVGPRPLGYHGCHYDGDKQNNLLPNLRWDSVSANALDKRRQGRDAQARKTHCAHGHEYNAENTIYRTDKTGRRCRACSKNDRVRRTAKARAQKEASK